MAFILDQEDVQGSGSQLPNSILNNKLVSTQANIAPLNPVLAAAGIIGAGKQLPRLVQVQLFQQIAFVRSNA